MKDRRSSLGQVIGGLLVFVAPWLQTAASGQAVGFQPIPAPLPSGVMLNAAPAVSADRRYVRMGVNAAFNDVRGFSTFSVPAAVSGGGVGMNGPIGGAAGGGIGAGAMGPGGVNGLIGGLNSAGNVNGAIGSSAFPFPYAVSGGFGGYGPFGGGMAPTAGWGDASWGGQGMGMGPGMGMGGFGMPSDARPDLHAPGQGEPLIGNGFAGPGQAGASIDPFEQAKNQPRLGPLQPPQGRMDRNHAKTRSSRSRARRGAPRTASPSRAKSAQPPSATAPPANPQ